MMQMRVLLATCTGLALMAAPAALAAQDAPPVFVTIPAPGDAEPAPSDDAVAMAQLAGMMGDMFKAEPLTPEQEARLPAAQKVIARIVPEGSMADMSRQLFGGILGSLDEIMPSGAKTAVAQQIGAPAYAFDLTDEQAAEVASLFDPAWQERDARMKSLIPDMITELMVTMEPSMRQAMSELYAIKFSVDELTAIDGFFATETGAKYARESFAMASDPRLMAASMEAMPSLFAMMGSLEQRMAERMADLPAARSFYDLDPKERAAVAELTGFTVEDIEANLGVPTVTIPPPEPATE